MLHKIDQVLFFRKQTPLSDQECSYNTLLPELRLCKPECPHLLQEKLDSLFDYDFNQKLDHIRPNYSFDVTCQGSVPQAIIAFLESRDFEDAIRNAISLGGDADTQACIAGALAEAHYMNIPDQIKEFVFEKITPDLSYVTNEFLDRTRIVLN